MPTLNNSINSKFTNNATGFTLGGGTTVRNITIAGIADFGISGQTATTFSTPTGAGAADILLGASAYSAAGTLLYGSGTGTYPTTLAAGTSGQVLTSAGATVSWAAVPFAAMPLVSQSTALNPMVVNTAYQTTGASNVSLTLPSTAAAGSMIRVTANSAGGFTIAQPASVTIHFSGTDTTTGTGGSVVSVARYDTISLYCSTANTDWTVLSCVGNFTIN